MTVWTAKARSRKSLAVIRHVSGPRATPDIAAAFPPIIPVISIKFIALFSSGCAALDDVSTAAVGATGTGRGLSGDNGDAQSDSESEHGEFSHGTFSPRRFGLLLRI